MSKLNELLKVSREAASEFSTATREMELTRKAADAAHVRQNEAFAKMNEAQSNLLGYIYNVSNDELDEIYKFPPPSI